MENNYFALLANDVKKLWNGLDDGQKLGMLGLIIVTIIAATFFLSKAMEPDWVVLYSDLNEVNALSIVENMKKNGYQYKVSEDKKTILVPSNIRDDMRVFVAENDLIKNGDAGIFGDCSTAVSDAFEEIFTGQTDEYTTNGAAVKYIYDHILTGNVDQVKEYFNGFDASEYLKSRAIFSTYNSPATIKKVGDTYEVGFNDGYMNGKNNTLPFLWIFSDTQQVAKTVTAILSSIYGLNMNTVDINNILTNEYNIVNKAYSDYYQYGTQNANYTVNTIPWTQLKSALIDLGLNANDNISIKKYYINSFNALFNNIDSAVSRNMVLSRIAFDYRFLTGGNNYRSINQAIAPVGYWFGSEKDLHTKDDDGLAKGMARAGFTAIFEQTYIEIRSSEELKAEVAELIDDVLEAYIEMADNSWIAASSTRNAMKKKLQYMTYISCYSDFYKSFAKLGADGIGYQNVYDLTKLYSDASLDLYLSDVVDDSGQFSTYPSYTVNAFYSLNTNSFVILNGLAYGMSGETIEEKYGMLALVIGHEITHAFDSSGSQYDENGNQKDWFSFMEHLITRFKLLLITMIKSL